MDHRGQTEPMGKIVELRLYFARRMVIGPVVIGSKDRHCMEKQHQMNLVSVLESRLTLSI